MSEVLQQSNISYEKLFTYWVKNFILEHQAVIGIFQLQNKFRYELILSKHLDSYWRSSPL